MNFLAHLHLSPDTPDALLGSLLGDFVKGPVERAGYGPAITDAIRLHRAIDVFTDSHADVIAAKAQVSSARRRYAGVLIDVFFDHFLARDWEAFRAEPLEAFAARVYRGLQEAPHPVPDTFARMLPFLVAQDWLASYRELAGIDAALHRMSRRLTHGAPLADAVVELDRNYAGFEAAFHSFFPEVAAFARAHAAVA
jgi:acyl carrier protein phosphodiesterase